ncbi:MAG: serine hydrolase family protein [Opitutae bacterium]|nr:serine hydrolase family protein [Opitutae bacterium]
MSGHFPILLVPGYSGGGPLHWMRAWHAANPAWPRMALADWLSTSPQDWEDALERTLAVLPGPAVVIAHSVGCITVVRHVARGGGKIAGAFLVAPSDVERAPDLPMLRGFGPIPRGRLPFPAVVIASTDDPYASVARSTEWAENWGAELRVLEGLGHINSDSDLGMWPVGQALWREFLDRLPGA